MKIILEQKDLEKAVTAFIEDTGVCLVGKTVSLDITVGRGTNGNSATVDIIDEAGTEDSLPVENTESEKGDNVAPPTGPVFGDTAA